MELSDVLYPGNVIESGDYPGRTYRVEQMGLSICITEMRTGTKLYALPLSMLKSKRWQVIPQDPPPVFVTKIDFMEAYRRARTKLQNNAVVGSWEETIFEELSGISKGQ